MILSTTTILVAAIVLFAIITIVKGIRIVNQSDVVVVERLGKYRTTLSGGLNFIVPWIDSERARLTSREDILDLHKQSTITRDNVAIEVDGIVYIKVDDARSATYSVVDYKKAVENLAMTTLRSEIGSLDLDETLSNRERLNAALQQALGAAASNWGVTVTRVEVSAIEVPEEISKAMNLQMEAERRKRATETKAEGDKNAQIKAAEAFKQEEVLKAEAIERMADAKRYEQERVAEGQKAAMESINAAMAENPTAAEFMLAKDRVAAFEKLAASDSANKVILPYEVSQMVGSMSVLSDILLNKNS